MTKQEAAITMQLHTVPLLFVVLGLSTAMLMPGGSRMMTQQELQGAAVQKMVRDAIEKLDRESECANYIFKKLISGRKQVVAGFLYHFVIEADVQEGPECGGAKALLTPGENQHLVLKIYEPPAGAETQLWLQKLSDQHIQ